MEELSYELRELTDTELAEVAGGGGCCGGDGNALINVENNTVIAPITVVVVL
jgi:bacteriocin-like protein